MLGVILCGGQSSRMGHDKGLFIIQTNTWAQIAKKKLNEISLSCILSINKKQHKEYVSRFKESELIIDDSQITIGGPLLGILSVHRQFPEQDLFVLACDLPYIENSALLELLVQAKKNDKPEAWVFKRGNQIEPLCGIYRASGLAKIQSAYGEKKLARQSVIHALEKLQTHYIPLKKEWIPFFRNVNAPSDL